MGWDQVARETLAHNPDLAAAQATLRKSSSAVTSSYSEFYPQLTGIANWDEGNSKKSGTDTSGLSDVSANVREQYTLGIQFKESFFTGFRDVYRVDQAKAAETAATEGLNATRSQALASARSAFLGLLYAQKSVALSEAIVKRLKENVRLVQLRFDRGRENHGSLLNVKALLSSAKFDLSQSQRSQRSAQRALASAMGRPDLDEIRVHGAFSTEKLIVDPDFRKLAEESPALKKAAAENSAAEYGVGVAKSGFYPDLSFVGEVAAFGESIPLDDRKWSVGVHVTWPFFPGGRNISDYHVAVAERERSNQAFESTRNLLSAQIEQAYYAMENALEARDVKKDFMSAAEVRAEIMRTKYRSGLASYEDWDQVESDLVTRQKDQLASLRDASVAEANFNQLIGK